MLGTSCDSALARARRERDSETGRMQGVGGMATDQVKESGNDEQFARPGVPHAHQVDDVAGFEAGGAGSPYTWRPRWQLFLPTAAILVFYSAAWLWLHFGGRGDSALARLFLIVMAVGAPLLAAHAFLRFQTIRVQVLSDAVRYHPGWPRDLPIDMPIALIEKVRVKRGLSGLVFGGGTLVLTLTTGETAVIADLSNPDGAKAAIESRMGL
ncbi:MAG: hypothetical protein WBO55_02880 [Rhizobiaceae bacterium]